MCGNNAIYWGRARLSIYVFLCSFFMVFTIEVHSESAQIIYFDSPNFRLGIDQKTALPVFLGIGASGSKGIEKNLIASDTLAQFDSPGGCQLKSISQREKNKVVSIWEASTLGIPVKLEYAVKDSGLLIDFSRGMDKSPVINLSLKIPFDPLVTSTTFLSSTMDGEGNSILPGVLSAPDYGQLQIEARSISKRNVRIQMVGSRKQHRLFCLIRFSLNSSENLSLYISKFNVPEIPGVVERYRETVQKAWFNIFTVRAENDTSLFQDPFPPMYRVSQLIANNTLSDPVSFTFFNAADMAFLTNNTSVLSLMRIVQHSISYWMDNKITPRGAAIGYTDYSIFLDSNPSLLISAWDVMECFSDTTWLKKYIRKLEMLGNYLAARDIDGDGIVEAEMPGTPGLTLAVKGMDRSSNWIDAVNFGHKDAFVNALIYRGWLCLADMERRLGNISLAMFYEELADKLKKNYYVTFYNPTTSLLSPWIDAKGRKVNYRFPNVNGLAVSLGVVTGEQARLLMGRAMQDIKNSGFTRYDLGVPLTIDPIDPLDYLEKGFGYPDPKLPDKNWQKYQNGGISPTQTAYYLHGLIRAGFKDEADRILTAMLMTQRLQGFQNGIIDKYLAGAEWKTWSGEPCGYEGYLNDNYYYLLTAAIINEDNYRKLFRPTWR